MAFVFVETNTIDVTASTAQSTSDESSYGVDVSFPILQYSASTNYPWLPHNVDPEHHAPPPLLKDTPLQILGDRQKAFLDHLDGCRERSQIEDPTRCDFYENYRILMNRRQPQSMKNYTELGFQKVQAPPKVVKLITDFWNANQFRGKEELWSVGNHYLNHWDSPTDLVSIDDKHLRGSGPELKEHIWAAASATLEEWTSQELQPCSMYGIRVYHEGAVMLPHVDRLPLVASAMINVAQDVDEPWPFEMYDHTGRAHNITLDPGDMLLFESHSVIHGTFVFEKLCVIECLRSRFI